jgi:hypothetical protein
MERSGLNDETAVMTMAMIMMADDDDDDEHSLITTPLFPPFCW